MQGIFDAFFEFGIGIGGHVPRSPSVIAWRRCQLPQEGAFWSPLRRGSSQPRSPRHEGAVSRRQHRAYFPARTAPKELRTPIAKRVKG